MAVETIYHELQLRGQVSRYGGLAREFRGSPLRSLTVSALDHVCSSCWGGICISWHSRNLEADSSFALMVDL